MSTIHDIRDHAHEWRRVEERRHEDRGDRVVVEACRFDDCDGWRLTVAGVPKQTTPDAVASGGER